jgi:hypothetical protein
MKLRILPTVIYLSVDVIDPSQRVELSVKDVSVEKILDILFADRNIRHEIIDNSIIVLLPGNTNDNRTLTGAVTESGSGEPLPGVYIRIEGTKSGSITGADGTYSITVPGPDAILTFSYIGYREQTLTVGYNKVLNIDLIPDIQTLEEVVVIGYGVTTRRNFTGAVTTVDMESSPSALSNATNISGVLRGNSTGILLSQSGTSGEQPSILIRDRNQ